MNHLWQGVHVSHPRSPKEDKNSEPPAFGTSTSTLKRKWYRVKCKKTAPLMEPMVAGEEESEELFDSISLRESTSTFERPPA